MKHPDNYNFVFMPDTQNTIKFTPNVMYGAMDWLSANQNITKISAIAHLGDVVENWNDTAQLAAAKNAFYRLPSAGINLLMQPGNHDYSGTNYSNYLNNFGPNSDFPKISKDNLFITSPSGMSSYIIVDGGSYKYIVLALSHSHLANTTSTANVNEQTWFENVLKANPNIPTIVTSHDLQSNSDAQPSAIQTDTYGARVWNIIRKYDQVFMMVGGHNHGAGHQVLSNDSGKEVISVLADYQFGYNGGNAFFKFAEFDEIDNKIVISTFSPYAASMDPAQKTFFDVNYLTGLGNYVELPFNFAERFTGAEPSDPVLELTTDANLIKAGDYFRLYPAFSKTELSNVATLTVTFDSDKFQYRGFTPCAGVTLVNSVINGRQVKVTVMAPNYEMISCGEFLFSALDDAVLANEDNVIKAAAELVVKAGDGAKSIKNTEASITFTTSIGSSGGKYTLLDLSNLIDWFGAKTGDPEWAQARFFDYNGNGEIDIQDIAALAQMI